jgi:hypothetical protein
MTRNRSTKSFSGSANPADSNNLPVQPVIMPRTQLKAVKSRIDCRWNGGIPKPMKVVKKTTQVKEETVEEDAGADNITQELNKEQESKEFREIQEDPIEEKTQIFSSGMLQNAFSEFLTSKKVVPQVEQQPCSETESAKDDNSENDQLDSEENQQENELILSEDSEQIDSDTKISVEDESEQDVQDLVEISETKDKEKLVLEEAENIDDKESENKEDILFESPESEQVDSKSSDLIKENIDEPASSIIEGDIIVNKPE